MKTILVFTNCKDQKEAKLIATRLLEKKLIACANIYPVHSRYIWKGEMKKVNEVSLIMKSRSSLYKDIEAEIKLVHSYENPEIICIESSDVSKEYADWIKEETKKPTKLI